MNSLYIELVYTICTANVLPEVLNDAALKVVDRFKYLGHDVTGDIERE